MKNILIYKQEGNLCVTHFVDSLTIEAVHEQAQKILPFGVLYRIGTTEEIPQDRTFRDAWDIEDSDLNDGIGGETSAGNSLSTSKENLSTYQNDLKLIENDLKDAEANLEKLTAEYTILSNTATEKEKVWADTKDSAFAAKSEWEQNLSAAENAEKIVADKGEEASEEEKQSAVDLRKIAELSFKTQDELFNNKREAVNARLESDKFVEKLNNQNNKINNVKKVIVNVNSMVAQYETEVKDYQQKLTELLNKLPLENRRGYVAPETQESTDDKN